MSPRLAEKKEYVIGFDIGGTGIKVAVYEVKDGEIINPDKPVWTEELKTSEKKEKFLTQLREILADANAFITDKMHGKILAAGFVMPGRFGQDGIVKKGTIPKMGDPTQYDDQNIIEILTTNTHNVRGYESSPLSVENDAGGMLKAMIVRILRKGKDRIRIKDQFGEEINPHLLRKGVVGIGTVSTGFGNFFARVKRDGSIEFVTDGHVSKTWIRLDKEDKYLRDLEGILRHPEKKRTVRCEELVSANGIAAMVGLKNAGELEQGNEKHEAAVRLAGKYHARVIKNIVDGKIRDVNPDQQWSKSDIKAAKKLRFYILAGGIMKDPYFGPMYYKACANEMDMLDLHKVRLINLGGHERGVTAVAASSALEAYKEMEKGRGGRG